MKTVSFVKALMVAVVLLTGTIVPSARIIDRAPQPIESAKAVSARIVYPELAKRCLIEGQVNVTVTVDQNGNVIDVKVKRGNGIGFGCDEAALEAASKMQFAPLNDGSNKVTATFTVPFIFKLKR